MNISFNALAEKFVIKDDFKFCTPNCNQLQILFTLNI